MPPGSPATKLTHSELSDAPLYQPDISSQPSFTIPAAGPSTTSTPPTGTKPGALHIPPSSPADDLHSTSRSDIPFSSLSASPVNTSYSHSYTIKSIDPPRAVQSPRSGLNRSATAIPTYRPPRAWPGPERTGAIREGFSACNDTGSTPTRGTTAPAHLITPTIPGWSTFKSSPGQGTSVQHARGIVPPPPTSGKLSQDKKDPIDLANWQTLHDLLDEQNHRPDKDRWLGARAHGAKKSANTSRRELQSVFTGSEDADVSAVPSPRQVPFSNSQQCGVSDQYLLPSPGTTTTGSIGNGLGPVAMSTSPHALDGFGGNGGYCPFIIGSEENDQAGPVSRPCPGLFDTGQEDAHERTTLLSGVQHRGEIPSGSDILAHPQNYVLTSEPHRMNTQTTHASLSSLSVPTKIGGESKKKREYWPPPPAAVAVFKCALAYLIASLFTFVPALSALLSTSSETDAHGRVTRRPAYSAHMVATIVVYFNPSKTLGNMLLSTQYCILLAALASGISMLSIATVQIFDHFSPSMGSNGDWISEIGDWIVCILWIGGSMGWLAWAKLWVGNPSFNTGCSMAAVTLFTVVIKQGGMPKLAEVLLIVLIGATITNLVCFLVFPVSATSRLQKSISTSLNSFSTLLDLLTSTFLLERAVLKENRMDLSAAVRSHGTAFKTLKMDLAEAKHERVIDPRMRGRKLELYDAAIGSLTRLAQHLSGLRSSTRLQEALVAASKEGRIQLDFEKHPKISASILDNTDPEPGLASMPERDISTTVNLFLQFRKISGDEMTNLVAQCDEALDAVEDIIKPQNGSHQMSGTQLSELRTILAVSLKHFTRSSSRAIKRAYAGPKREAEIYLDGKSDESDEDDDEEVTSTGVNESFEGPNETVFLIYFFLFTLEEFARELLFLLDTVVEILADERVTALDHFKWITSPWANRRLRRPQTLYRQLQNLVPIDPSKLQPPLFPKNQRDSRGTLLTPSTSQLGFFSKILHMVWEFGARLREPDMRYAIKTGLAGAILAAPAYTEWGRPMFLEYRGEWALIAFFATMSPTVGQTNFLSVFRVIGTILGAAVAVLAYTLFPENPVALPIFGFFFSMPCFYIITQMPDYLQSGRFILLTYNLTCLYAYNQRDKDLAPITIAIRRSTSVIIGVVWAAIVSRYWWPYTARRELRIGLSDFFLDLSYLYSKLVTTYSRGVDPPDRDEEAAFVAAATASSSADPLSTFRPTSTTQNNGNTVFSENQPLLSPSSTRHLHLSPSVRQFMAMELHLQSQLSYLRQLLVQTKNEPRLKGPFAYGFYHDVLLSGERMLDRFHSMRCVTTRDEWDNGIRRAFVVPVNHLRREMAGSVILYLYVLSAGFRLRTPMPPYLPPAERARQRLVEAIRGLDVVRKRSVRGGGRHLLFFAYALAMQEVIAELDFMGSLLQDAFGVISQSTVMDFENLFQTSSNTDLESGGRIGVGLSSRSLDGISMGKGTGMEYRNGLGSAMMTPGITEDDEEMGFGHDLGSRVRRSEGIV